MRDAIQANYMKDVCWDAVPLKRVQFRNIAKKVCTLSTPKEFAKAGALLPQQSIVGLLRDVQCCQMLQPGPAGR